MLETKNIGIVFGGLTALDEVNMSVNQGEIYGLIGPNGSGKTTMINIISGFYSPTRGEVLFDGQHIEGKKAHVVARMGIGRTFQNINIFPEMSALDNVTTVCGVHESYNILDVILRTKKYRQQEREAREKAMEQLEFVGLADEKDVLAKNMPYGKRRLLEIARLLATDPKFVLLDEPVAGMNEQESDMVAQIVRKMRDEGAKTILLIEHHMRFVMNICDCITVLNSGRVIAQGAPFDIQNNQDVISCYLGRGRK